MRSHNSTWMTLFWLLEACWDPFPRHLTLFSLEIINRKIWLYTLLSGKTSWWSVSAEKPDEVSAETRKNLSTLKLNNFFLVLLHYCYQSCNDDVSLHLCRHLRQNVHLSFAGFNIFFPFRGFTYPLMFFSPSLLRNFISVLFTLTFFFFPFVCSLILAEIIELECFLLQEISQLENRNFTVYIWISESTCLVVGKLRAQRLQRKKSSQDLVFF